MSNGPIMLGGPNPPPPGPDDIVGAMVGIGRFAMAEAVARQVNLRPLEVMGTVNHYIDPAQGITEVTMAMIVDKAVDHIKSGKGLL